MTFYPGVTRAMVNFTPGVRPPTDISEIMRVDPEPPTRQYDSITPWEDVGASRGLVVHEEFGTVVSRLVVFDRPLLSKLMSNCGLLVFIGKPDYGVEHYPSMFFSDAHIKELPHGKLTEGPEQIEFSFIEKCRVNYEVVRS